MSKELLALLACLYLLVCWVLMEAGGAGLDLQGAVVRGVGSAGAVSYWQLHLP